MNDPANLHNDEARCLGERLASPNDGSCLCNMGGGFLSRGADGHERVETMSHFNSLWANATQGLLSNKIILSKQYCAVCLLQVVFVMKTDAGSGLEAYLPSDLSSLRQNPKGKPCLLLRTAGRSVTWRWSYR